MITLSSFFSGNPQIPGIVLKLLTKITRRTGAVIRGHKAKKKLKKSGYRNWREYKHNRDPDIHKYANYIQHFYKNYPYVYAIKDYKHYAFKCVGDYGPGGLYFGYDEMTDWCEEKIRWNYRRDIHRVIENASEIGRAHV